MDDYRGGVHVYNVGITPFYINKHNKKEVFKLGCCGNINSGCNRCRSFVATIAVVTDGSNLVLQIPSNNYINNTEVCIAIAQNIPALTGILPVKVQIGTDTTLYDMITRNGHNVYSDQVRKRNIYCTSVATDTLSFVYNGRCGLPCTDFIMPGSIPITQATNVAAAASLNMEDYNNAY